MENPLSRVDLRHWYTAWVAAAAAVLIAALTTDHGDAAIIALGALLIGFGEWVNHPERSTMLPSTLDHPAGILTIKSRQPSLWGWTLDILGVVLVVFGAYRLLGL